MDQIFTQHGGIVGILAVIILLLVKDFLKDRNGVKKQIQERKEDKKAHDANCPVILSGGVPISKTQHDELCEKKMEVIAGSFKLVGEKLEFLKEGQTAVKLDIKEIKHILRGIKE